LIKTRLAFGQAVEFRAQLFRVVAAVGILAVMKIAWRSLHPNDRDTKNRICDHATQGPIGLSALKQRLSVAGAVKVG
jgi:hypothetical protein